LSPRGQRDGATGATGAQGPEGTPGASNGGSCSAAGNDPGSGAFMLLMIGGSLVWRQRRRRA
jgi:MYXO-CTERM domain-containing protein